MIEHRRPQFPGQEADVVVDHVRQIERALDLLAALTIVVAKPLLHSLERQAQRRQALPELVVQIAGDTAALVLLRGHDFPEQADDVVLREQLFLDRQLQRARPLGDLVIEVVLRLAQRVRRTAAGP